MVVAAGRVVDVDTGVDIGAIEVTAVATVGESGAPERLLGLQESVPTTRIKTRLFATSRP